jgi:hypothetical protein
MREVDQGLSSFIKLLVSRIVGGVAMEDAGRTTSNVHVVDSYSHSWKATMSREMHVLAMLRFSFEYQHDIGAHGLSCRKRCRHDLFGCVRRACIQPMLLSRF